MTIAPDEDVDRVSPSGKRTGWKAKMTNRRRIDNLILDALARVPGLKIVSPFRETDRQTIVDLERKAEAQSLMGLGKVINAGVQSILERDCIYAALTTMDFDWGCYTTLLLKKGAQIVGEEVRDPNLIQRLSMDKNAWFLHRNFVVYKDRITFPQDIMKKICHFEIPCLPALFCKVDEFRAIDFANPCVPADMFLKEAYFEGVDEKGLGTILVGVAL